MDEQIVLTMPVSITSKNEIPAVRLRKEVTDIEVMKKLLSAAFHEVPIVIVPKFVDKFVAVNNMQEKGMIYKDDNGEFRFTF